MKKFLSLLFASLLSISAHAMDNSCVVSESSIINEILNDQRLSKLVNGLRSAWMQLNKINEESSFTPNLIDFLIQPNSQKLTRYVDMNLLYKTLCCSTLFGCFFTKLRCMTVGAANKLLDSIAKSYESQFKQFGLVMSKNRIKENAFSLTPDQVIVSNNYAKTFCCKCYTDGAAISQDPYQLPEISSNGSHLFETTSIDFIIDHLDELMSFLGFLHE